MKKLLNFGMVVLLAGACSLSLQAGQFGVFQQGAKQAAERKAAEDAQKAREAQAARDAQTVRDSQAQRDTRDSSRGDRVCIFEESRYEGWTQCFGPGDQISDLKSHNNRITSVRVFGRANVVLFDEKNFRGNEIHLADDISDLNTRNMQRSGALLATWDNKVESLRVELDRNGTTTSTRDRREPRDGICVYDRVGYQGRSQCWNAGDSLPDLTRTGADWSDRISSIRVFGRGSAELFSDLRFRGDRLSIDRDVSDLSQYRLGGPGNNGRGRGNGNVNGNGNGNGRGNNNRQSWNDEVSSLRVLSDRRADNRR